MESCNAKSQHNELESAQIFPVLSIGTSISQPANKSRSQPMIKGSRDSSWKTNWSEWLNKIRRTRWHHYRALWTRIPLFTTLKPLEAIWSLMMRFQGRGWGRTQQPHRNLHTHTPPSIIQPGAQYSLSNVQCKRSSIRCGDWNRHHFPS